jgi:Ca-activated chloride channel family protein
MDTQYRVYDYLYHDARQFGGGILWLLFRVLPGCLLAVMLLLCLASLAPLASATAHAVEEGGVADLDTGHMLLYDGQGTGFTAAVLQSSKVHFDISGMVATVTVEQSFRNDSGRWLEGVYAFPLPDAAAVRAMEMLVGERRIIGRIRERAEAQIIYREAKAAGKRTSLVEQQRPNLFSNRVANIAPGETIVVRLEYVQQVAYRAGRFSLRFPATITARYMPGAPLAAAVDPDEPLSLEVNPYLGWAVPTTAVADADAISPLQYPQPGSEQVPLNPLEVTVRLDMGIPLAKVEAPYHDITLARRAGVYDIRLANGVSEMDRDFVLAWQPVSGAAPTAALFTEEVAGEYYGLLLVLPPADERAPPPLPREIIFVVDTSGSMGGLSIRQARSSLGRALQALRPEDRFNIIEFNSTHQALYRRPLPATPEHVQRALEFVSQLEARGGTEMLPALRAALAVPGDDDLLEERLPLRQVIFITDGAVGNEAALFEEISASLGASRLFTVGIGAAPNSWFMREAARYGRGTHTHIGSLEEVEDQMAGLFEQLSRPAAVDLEIEWPAPVEAWPQRIPDLYLGEPLLVAVKFGAALPAGELRVKGRLGEADWAQRIQVAAAQDPLAGTAHKGVASLWARYKIAGLLDQLLRGRSPDAVRADVLPLALQHQLLSPYTSFVAVEERIARPAGEPVGKVAVPNTRPQGQTPQSFAYPRTATTGPAKLWLGTLLVFLATLLRVLRQPEVDHVPDRGN